jgi:hypothetical protein
VLEADRLERDTEPTPELLAAASAGRVATSATETRVLLAAARVHAIAAPLALATTNTSHSTLTPDTMLLAMDELSQRAAKLETVLNGTHASARGCVFTLWVAGGSAMSHEFVAALSALLEAADVARGEVCVCACVCASVY